MVGERAEARREAQEREKARQRLPQWIPAGAGLVVEAGEYSDKCSILHRATAVKGFSPFEELEAFLRSRSERSLRECAGPSAQQYAFVAWLVERGCIAEEPSYLLDLQVVDGLAIVLEGK